MVCIMALNLFGRLIDFLVTRVCFEKWETFLVTVIMSYISVQRGYPTIYWRRNI